MKRFLLELRQRNVHRAAAAYLAVAWIVLQVTEVMMEIYDLDPAGVQWVVALLAVGFLPAMAMSWVFELSLGGLRRESELDPAEPEQGARARRADRIIIALLALGIGVLLADRFLFATSRSDDAPEVLAQAHPSIAVLPFLDLSAERNQDHLASGIAEELLNLLARIPGLDVVARTSSFVFKGRAVPIAEIAAQLNVRYVLEGSVRTSGGRLRITAQLIDAASGFHIWSQNYDSEDADLFDIQDDVASRVVRALEPALLAQLPRMDRTDPRAHTLVLEGEHLASQLARESLTQAAQRFRAALDIDPNYARAWLGLSVTYNNMASTGVLDADDAHGEATAAARRSLELDPDSAGAYDQLAWGARAYADDARAAAAYLEQALARAPRNPDVIGHAAVLLQSIGRLDEALPLHEYSVARDPLDATGIYNLALAYYFADRMEDAERELRRVLRLVPQYPGARHRLGTVVLRQGRFDTALHEFEAEPDPEFRMQGRALGLFALGRHDEADAALARLIDDWGAQWPSEVAQVYAYRGEIDRAFEWLEKDYAVAGSAGWGEWRLMHLYENLHADPRWAEFLERVGASDAQLADIPFTPGSIGVDAR